MLCNSKHLHQVSNFTYSNFIGSGEQTTEVMNGEVNGQEQKDDTTAQIVTTEPVNGVLHEDAGEHVK